VEARTVKSPNKTKAVKEVSVMVWIENQFGEVLLLKQKAGNKLWTLPGGKVRPRESLERAIHREVLEETGLRIDDLNFQFYFDRAPKEVISFLFSARIKGRSDTVKPRTGEIETAAFSASLPRNATPSLSFFWKHVRETRNQPG
jgi:ADP-ribose pyrophosphatase YjhB (NUDIX family)